MVLYLNESQAGCDQDTVAFPHLLVCMGVVLETGARLYGFHFDNQADSGSQAGLFAAFIANQNGTVPQGVRLYGCTNWKIRYPDRGRAAWKAEMQAIASAIGYTGKVSGFDTGIINPQDGTYVEYIAEHAQGRCRIYYKRNEKMCYTQTVVSGLNPPQNLASYSKRGTDQFVPAQGYIKHTTGAAIYGQSKKRRLHELNYFLRLVTFNI